MRRGGYDGSRLGSDDDISGDFLSLSLMTFLKIVSQRISHDDDDDGTQMMSSPHDVTMVSLCLGRTRMR